MAVNEWNTGKIFFYTDETGKHRQSIFIATGIAFQYG